MLFCNRHGYHTNNNKKTVNLNTVYIVNKKH